MKIIELTEVGYMGKDWFWNTQELENSNPFHLFMSFTAFDSLDKILINADMIETMEEGIPTIYVKTKAYVKRNKFIEFFFGKKHEVDFKSKSFKDKVTWIKLTSGKTFYVSESIEQIEDMVKGN